MKVNSKEDLEKGLLKVAKLFSYLKAYNPKLYGILDTGLVALPKRIGDELKEEIPEIICRVDEDKGYYIFSSLSLFSTMATIFSGNQFVTETTKGVLGRLFLAIPGWSGATEMQREKMEPPLVADILPVIPVEDEETDADNQSENGKVGGQ